MKVYVVLEKLAPNIFGVFSHLWGAEKYVKDNAFLRIEEFELDELAPKDTSQRGDGEYETFETIEDFWNAMVEEWTKDAQEADRLEARRDAMLEKGIYDKKKRMGHEYGSAG